MTSGRDRSAAAEKATVLAVDYPGYRDGARITDLRLDADGYAMVDVLGDPVPEVPDARRYAQRLLDRCPPDGAIAVLAYCLAGPIAHELVDLLPNREDGPTGLILFDCQPATPEVIGASYRKTLAQLGDHATATTLDRLTVPPVPSSVGDIRQELFACAVAAMLDDGEPADEATHEAAQELADHHLRWFMHLMAAGTARFPAWGGDALHVVSEDHPYTSDWPGAKTTTTVRVRCVRDDLLHAAQTRSAVLSWLDRYRNDRTGDR